MPQPSRAGKRLLDSTWKIELSVVEARFCSFPGMKGRKRLKRRKGPEALAATAQAGSR
jgi:hypothetical protein